jgi:hypothetical protein
MKSRRPVNSDVRWLSMSTWKILALGWLVLGLLSYVAILIFFPPMPILLEDREADVPPIARPRSFSVRDLSRNLLLLISNLPQIMVVPKGLDPAPSKILTRRLLCS